MREEELAGTSGGVSEVNVDAGVGVDAEAGTCAAGVVDGDGDADGGDVAVEEGLEETGDDALEASERLRPDRSPAPEGLGLGGTVPLRTKVCLFSSWR